MTADEKLKRYWAGKRRSKHGCSLTMDDIQVMLDEADITIWDVGRGHGAYQLSRVNDTGGYHVGNCRFLTTEENNAEY